MIRALSVPLAFVGAIGCSSLSHAAGAQFGELGFPGGRAPHASTARQSCGQVQALVANHNHAVLTFGPTSLWSGYGTERVVKDIRYCLGGESTQPIWVPTRDSAACFAGFTCDSGSSSGNRRGR